MDTGERPTSLSFETVPSLMKEAYKFGREYAKNKDVLDVGCGEGYVTVYLSEVAKQVIGIDVDRKVVNSTNKRFANIKNVAFYKMSGEKLEFPSSSFDLVISSQSIEHIKEDARFLSEVRRILSSENRGRS